MILKKIILIPFLLVFSSYYSEYSIVKVANDQCLTPSKEGSIRVYATGKSGPYTVKGPNNQTKTIGIGSTSTLFTSIGEGDYTLTITNTYGCETILTTKILKVNCGDCPTVNATDISYIDYPIAGTNTISNVSSNNLLLLKQYFTSDFTIDSDLLAGKICVRNACLNPTPSQLGFISYSSVTEMEERLKNPSNKIKVKLFDLNNNEIISTTVNGMAQFNNLTSGSYTFKVILQISETLPQEEEESTANRSGNDQGAVTTYTNIIISERIINVLQKNCNKGSVNLAVNDNPESSESDEGEQNLTTSLNQIDLLNSIDAYPNPFQDNLTISINSYSNQKASLSILNTLGEAIIKEEFSLHEGMVNKQYNLSKTSNGIYTISLKIGESYYSTKLVKID